MDRLTAMQAFVTVVDSGGFTAAANQLPISRAGVSKHVAELEAHLHVRLLNRTTRRISLTEAGQAYFERCKRILEDIDDSECLVSGLTSDPHGRLRINVPMSYGINRIAPLLAEFRRRYPRIMLELKLNDRLIDVVEEGYDVVIRIARLADSSLIARKLSRCDFALCASADYLERHGQPSVPADLERHACLIYQQYANQSQWEFYLDEQQYAVKVMGPLITNNGTIIARAACDGMGIAMLPLFIIENELANGKLQVVLEKYKITPLNIYAIYPSSRHLSAKVRHFVDYLLACLEN